MTGATLKIESVMRTSTDILGYVIRNHSNARHFLEAHARFFGRISDGPGRTAYFIETRRYPKFLAYIKTQGVTVAH